MRICCRLSTVLHMTQTTGGNAATAGRLVLLRHGQTVWSESGQHTGRTDIPLTAEGERQARDAGTRIQTAFPQGFGENCVYASPLKRAQQTASLAGFAPRTLPALAEWDYGRAEGRTRQTIAQLHGGSWELWNDGPDALSPTMEGDWTETLPDDCAGLILVGGMSWATPEAERIVPLVREALSHGILVGAICNAASFLAAHGFLNGVRHTGNGLEMLREWGGANYTGEKLYQERQAVRDGNVVTANGSGYLEFTRECLLALEADTPEQIAASYAFNKHGFYQE